MKKINKLALIFTFGTSISILKSNAVYINFEGKLSSLILKTPDQLENFYNESTDLTSCFKKKYFPHIINKYYKYKDFLKNYQTAEFIHIHPEWLLVSDSIIEKRNFKIGCTYQTNPTYILSPKFKIEEIECFDYEKNKKDLFKFSLIRISKGDEIGGEEPPDLVGTPKIMLFEGDTNRIKYVESIYNDLDKVIDILGKIKRGEITGQKEIEGIISMVSPIIDSLKDVPGAQPAVLFLKLLSLTKLTIGETYDRLIALRPHIRERTIRYELAQSLNDHKVFLASPYSHTKKNKLIFSHQYMPAMCRLNAARTPLGKDIKQFFKGLFTLDHGKTLTFHMFHKSHYWFACENKDSMPFDFLTMPGEDTGQPIFAYNPNTQEYSIVSINQDPNGHTTTVPVFFHPEIVRWIIDTTKDNYFREQYPVLVKLAGINLIQTEEPVEEFINTLDNTFLSIH